MPFTYALNTGHDMAVKDGKLVLVAGANEVKQRVLVALLHYWQEYFLDVPDGVPWYEVILGGKNKITTELILRRKILEVPGVISIVAFTVQYSISDPRHLDVYGTIEVQGLESETNTINVQLQI